MATNILIMLTSTGGDQVHINALHVFAVRAVNPTECLVVSTGGAEVKVRSPAGVVAMAVSAALNKGPGF